MKKDVLRQTTRPEQDINDLVEGFFDANDSVIEEMLLNYLESAGEIENTWDLTEAESILCNRIDQKLRKV